MDLKLTRQPLYLSDVLIDQTLEQPLECDALLPDYCPDIQRILKCAVAPRVEGRRAGPGKVELEGLAEVTVYYLSAAGGIARGEYKVPFSRIAEMKADHPAPVLLAEARTDYINCRAVNQRRLDIRGALVLTVRGVGSREEQAVAEAGAGLQLKREEAPASRLLGMGSRESRLSETVELPYGKPPIRAVVRAGASARVTECRQVAGKAVLRGELAVRILYQAAEGGYEGLEYTLPTSAICEVEGLDDQSVCDAWQEAVSLTAEPAAGEDGEYRRLALEAVVESRARAWQPYAARFCSDAYSTRGACAFRSRAVPLTRAWSAVREAFPFQETIPLPENVEEVLDLWCVSAGMTPRSEAGGPVADCRLTVGMFARMKDGQVYYFEKALETSRKLPGEGEGAVLDGRLACQGCTWTPAGSDSLELRLELELSGAVLTQGRAVLLEDIQVDEKKPREPARPPGLYLYLADPGETLWDIAKRYNTSADQLAAENPQGEDAGERRVLLIPVL